MIGEKKKKANYNTGRRSCTPRSGRQTAAYDDQWSEETREECEGGKGHKGRTTAQTTHNGSEIISKGAPGKATFVTLKLKLPF